MCRFFLILPFKKKHHKKLLVLFAAFYCFVVAPNALSAVMVGLLLSSNMVSCALLVFIDVLMCLYIIASFTFWIDSCWHHFDFMGCLKTINWTLLGPHPHHRLCPSFCVPGEVWCASSERHPSARLHAWQPKQRGQFAVSLHGLLFILYFTRSVLWLK